ncbi:MAG: c-type cytochrome [Desulfurivibrionaceae bacterium]
MQKRIVTMLTAMSLMLPAVAMAASGDALFLQSCGACHKKGGKAATVNPADKAGTVWEKYFARGRHPVPTGMSDADLQTVVKYLMAHAADSDQPAAAVIPK